MEGDQSPPQKTLRMGTAKGSISRQSRVREVLIFITMMTFLALFGGLFAVATALLLYEMHNAPEGYEDETGFHFVWRNNTPEAADVVCVWDLGSAHPAL
jgi:hypothetical protein